MIYMVELKRPVNGVKQDEDLCKFDEDFIKRKTAICTKICIIKRKLIFEDYKNCLQECHHEIK